MLSLGGVSPSYRLCMHYLPSIYFLSLISVSCHHLNLPLTITMPFSPFHTFHHKSVALAGDCHPFERHDQPNRHNSSLPCIQCLVAQLSLIPLYLGYGIEFLCKVFVADIVDGAIQKSSVGTYTASTFHLHARGMSKHTLLYILAARSVKNVVLTARSFCAFKMFLKRVWSQDGIKLKTKHMFWCPIYTYIQNITWNLQN